LSAAEQERDLALELLERYRGVGGGLGGGSYDDVDEYGYIGIVVDVLLRRGHPVYACSAAYRWYRYRRSLFKLYWRLRRNHEAPRDYVRAVEDELLMTMLVLGAYFYTCGGRFARLAGENGKRWARDLYAELVDCAKRLHAYMSPCLQYREQGRRMVERCWAARAERAARGADPLLIEGIMRKY